MSFSQAERPFRIKTQLGDDALLIDRFVGSDRVSAPFGYSLRVLSTDLNVDMNGQLMKPAVVSFVLSDGSDRHIHGLINQMRLASYGEDGLAAYEISMVPWLWFLHLFTNCRIFQNKSVLEILEQVFKDRGFTDFRDATSGSYQAREYCVQYRETDFNFVSRLLEEEGIFYFFEHTEDKHTLVLADKKSAFESCPNQAKAKYTPSEGTHLEEDTVITLQQQFGLFPGTATLTDYDFEKPSTRLLATLAGTQKGETYDYPGNYKTKDDGDRYTRVRLEEQERSIETVRGESNCMGFLAGYKFTLSDHPRDAANKDYTLLSVQHRGRNPSYAGGRQVEAFEYRNSFEAIPNSIEYRPPRMARKPIVDGSQTAVVVGKSGEEIWTDKYGRVKVQFFWDREGVFDENSSCWIRVAQLWAGKQWGAIFTPRIGQEVIVDFLEGDPDRPIITGRVYNADQTVPYALPGEQTKSTIKTMSSKGGSGFNEIRFEDKKDGEQIFMHGERNLDIRVKRDRMENILRDRHLNVTRDKMEKVGRDSHTDVDRDCIVQYGRDHHLTVSGKEAIKITGSHSMEVQSDVIEDFKGSQTTQVTQSIYVKGMSIVIEAATQLSLKVGASFVDIGPAGVTIVGTPLVMINSGGAAGVGVPGALVPPLAATAPTDADTADPGAMAQPASGQKAQQLNMEALRISPASDAPTHNPNSPENKKKPHWIEIKLVDEEGKPVPGEPYKITLPDGTTLADGTLDEKGFARVDGIDPGTCKVTFPNLDKDTWKGK